MRMPSTKRQKNSRQMPKAWHPLWPEWCVDLTPDGRGAPPVVEKIMQAHENGVLCPPLHQIWQVLEWTRPEEVKVVVLGQDPYHGPGQAHGVAFSVADASLPWPPSLRNVFKERASDVGCPIERPADLGDWVRQGVLLLNAVLTTEKGQAGAHQKLGWEEAVTEALCALCRERPRLVWVLWGKPAQMLHGRVLDRLGEERTEDMCIRSPHPSPLAAYRGFWGSRPFTKANEALAAWGQTPIVW